MSRNLTRILEAQRVVNGPTTKVVYTEFVRWTPGDAETSNIPIRSTWRDPIGKPLSSRRIRQLELDGWYGEARQQAAKSNTKNLNIILRCKCGATENLRFVSFAYLPEPGNYCRRCLDIHRAERDKEKELARRFHENLMREYV